MHADIVRVAVWGTTCIYSDCQDQPEVPLLDGAYPLHLSETFRIIIEVQHPGVEYRELSITVSQSWGTYPGDLARTFAEREDQVLLSGHRRVLGVQGRLPITGGTYSVKIHVEESGRDLPEPIIIERELAIFPLPPARASALFGGLVTVSATPSAAFANHAEVQAIYSEAGGVFAAEVTSLRVTVYASATLSGPVLLTRDYDAASFTDAFGGTRIPPGGRLVARIGVDYNGASQVTVKLQTTIVDNLGVASTQENQIAGH